MVNNDHAVLSVTFGIGSPFLYLSISRFLTAHDWVQIVTVPEGDVPPTILVQLVPLNTCSSPEGATQLLHHIINPGAGVVMASLCAFIIRGGPNPLVVELISSAAETLGDVAPITILPVKLALPATDNLFTGVVVPIPTLPSA